MTATPGFTLAVSLLGAMLWICRSADKGDLKYPAGP